MKKRIIVIIVLVIGIGIGFLFIKKDSLEAAKVDDNHAILVVETSSGKIEKIYSVNGIDSKEQAFNTKMQVTLKKGETADVTFVCDECDDEQADRIKQPGIYTFKCKCPGTKKERACVLFQEE